MALEKLSSPRFKSFLLIAGFVSLLVLTVVLIVSTTGSKYSPEDVGEKHFIQYEVVNLRDDHSLNGAVIAELSHGSIVTLTGYSYEGLGEQISSWVLIQTQDGRLGWVVIQSVDWVTYVPN